MTQDLVRKSEGSPDETRMFKNGKGKLDVFILRDATVGRGQYEPGLYSSAYTSAQDPPDRHISHGTQASLIQ